jgi:hypothetical protein
MPLPTSYVSGQSGHLADHAAIAADLLAKAGGTVTGATPVTIDTVAGGLVINGQATDTNALVIKLPSGTASGYGKGNAIAILEAGSGDATDNTETGSLLGRWDINGIGAPSVHVTPGYRNGQAPTQGIWVQNFRDATGLVITGYSSQTANLLTITASGGTPVLFTVLSTGTVQLNAGTAAAPAVANVAETGTGMYFTAGNVGLTINGTLKSFQSSTAWSLISGVHLAITAGNIITDTTTGMKIGTATTQKLGFYNATPIVQPTGTPADATNTATAVTLVNSLKASLIALGLIS